MKCHTLQNLLWCGTSPESLLFRGICDAWLKRWSIKYSILIQRWNGMLDESPWGAPPNYGQHLYFTSPKNEDWSLCVPVPALIAFALTRVPSKLWCHQASVQRTTWPCSPSLATSNGLHLGWTVAIQVAGIIGVWISRSPRWAHIVDAPHKAWWGSSPPSLFHL
jgi:hypothetical protein